MALYAFEDHEPIVDPSECLSVSERYRRGLRRLD
jgi:hypothetical protein